MLPRPLYFNCIYVLEQSQILLLSWGFGALKVIRVKTRDKIIFTSMSLYLDIIIKTEIDSLLRLVESDRSDVCDHQKSELVKLRTEADHFKFP